MAKYSQADKPLVAIEFYDHTEHTGNTDMKPYIIKLYGKLVGEDKCCYHIATWLTDGDTENEESVLYTILKSTVIKINKYKTPIR